VIARRARAARIVDSPRSRSEQPDVQETSSPGVPGVQIPHL
jgi:hypothetical protein